MADTLGYDDFEFAGLNSRTDLRVTMGNVVLPVAPEMADETTDIPGMYGKKFIGMDYQDKTITIPVSIYCDEDQKAFNQIIHNLSALLLSDDPADNGQIYPLRFGFDPTVTYWGYIQSISVPAPINPGTYNADLTITFIAEPRATLPQVEIPLKAGLNTINVAGTAQTEPVIQVIPKRDLKHIGFTLNGGQFGLGPDSDEDLANAQQAEDRVVDEPFGSMAYWSNDTNAISQIKTAGMANVTWSGNQAVNTDTGVLYVKLNSNGTKDYGAHSAGWYGPLVRYKGLTNSLTDYHITTRIHHRMHEGTHNRRARGRIEVLLLNPDGVTIARFGLADDSFGGIPSCYLQMCKPGSEFAGGDGKHVTLFNGKGPRMVYNKKDNHIKIPNGTTTKTVVKWSRNKRTGKVTKKTEKVKVNKYLTVLDKEEKSAISTSWLQLDMTKKGNTYTWSITQYYDSGSRSGQACTDPKRFLIVHGMYVDRKNEYNQALGGIASVMLKHSITEDDKGIAYENPYMSLTKLQISKVNDVPDNAPKYISHANDEIVMDCETDTTTVNGKLANPVWSTDYPKLKPGINSLDVVGDLSDAKIVLKYLPKIL